MPRQCVAVDFDGVLHSYDKGWQDGSIYGQLDFSLITELQDHDFAIAVVTARPISPVVACMRDHFRVFADFRMSHEFWSGGSTGRDVLVTNRKVAAIAYIDDRAIHYEFGDDKRRIYDLPILAKRLSQRVDGWVNV